MRAGAFFKNPDNADSSEFDELVDREEDDSRYRSCKGDDVVGYEVVNSVSGEDDSSDYEPTTDKSMSEDDTDGFSTPNKTNPIGKNTQTSKPKAHKNTQTVKSPAGVSSSQKNVNETDDDGGGTSVFDMDEDEEEDETKSAIIAAIKKTRVVPPEIKLYDFITGLCFHPYEWKYVCRRIAA